VVRVVDAPALHDQHVTAPVARQQLDRLQRSSRRATGSRAVLAALELETHVRRLEEAEHGAGRARAELVEVRTAPHPRSLGMTPLPGRDEVAPVRACADLSGMLGIFRPLRQELRAAAAEPDIDAVADLELDELARDVGNPAALASAGSIESSSQSRCGGVACRMRGLRG